VTLSAVAIIPARYGSTRFPGKPLARQTGKFLIQHVVEQVRLAACFERVIVATDDARIEVACREFGAEVVMTSSDHATGTDRIAEVARKAAFSEQTIIVNVQGDEPELDPSVLEQLVDRMARDPDCPVGTLATPFPPGIDPADPNRVKVVVDSQHRALFFSRSLIPCIRNQSAAVTALGDQAESPWLLHLGVYAYRCDFLLAFSTWPQGRLEVLEQLEQLRILERGHPLAVEQVPHGAEGIDTPEDYARFVERISTKDERVTGCAGPAAG
jgi:3-deoxy-manno-octulosonate cytidylyltransferase (CMP-KDO synthetase)